MRCSSLKDIIHMFVLHKKVIFIYFFLSCHITDSHTFKKATWPWPTWTTDDIKGTHVQHQKKQGATWHTATDNNMFDRLVHMKQIREAT